MESDDELVREQLRGSTGRPRIETVVLALARHWKKNPDQRLGQLLMNLIRASDGLGFRDPWNVKDEEWLELFGGPVESLPETPAPAPGELWRKGD